MVNNQRNIEKFKINHNFFKLQNNLLILILIIMINCNLLTSKIKKDEYSKFIIAKNKFIDNCTKDDTYKYEYNNICYKSCPRKTKNTLNNKYLCEKINPKSKMQKTNKKIKSNNSRKIILRQMEDNSKNSILSTLRNQIISHELDSQFYEGQKDIIIFDNDITYQITYTDNQNNNNNPYNNISSIKLGECEQILKNKYHINKNEPLIIFKIDYFEKGLLVPIIEYEIYHPNTNKILALSDCKNIGIEILTPVLVDDNINCISLCEDNCVGIEYNYNQKKYKCKCEIKEEMKLISQIEIKNWNSEQYFDFFCKIKENEDTPYLNDEIINNIKNGFVNGTLDKLITELLYGNNENIIIKTKDVGIQITTTNNPNIDEDFPFIDYGECENKLKRYYNIHEDEPLIVFMIKKYERGVAKIVFDFYNINKEILELNLCKDILDREFDIIEDLNNLSSEFNNDPCYAYESNNKNADIPLKDRYINNNRDICGEGCVYEGYDTNTKKVKCNCQNNSGMSSTNKDIKKTNIFQCTHLFLSKEGLKNNIGSFIMIFIIGSNGVIIIFYLMNINSIFIKEINKLQPNQFCNQNNNIVNNNDLPNFNNNPPKKKKKKRRKKKKK